jgi:Holliday junction resolvase RusA-like endonuclease
VGSVAALPPHHLAFTVIGTHVPLGSHKAFVVNGHAKITEDNKRSRPWRTDVKHAALDARGTSTPFAGPVDVDICFVMPRNKGHYGTGRNVQRLKDSAPRFPGVKPDVDKLARTVLDALTAAGVWKDDSQVVHLDVWKVYVGHDGNPNELPAAHISVMAAS